MRRSVRARYAAIPLALGVLAIGWLGCGKVENSEPMPDASTADAGIVVGDARCPDCGPGLRCVYDVTEGCASQGKCIVAYTGPCGKRPDTAFCPCDAGNPQMITAGCVTSYEPEQPVRGPRDVDICSED